MEFIATGWEAFRGFFSSVFIVSAVGAFGGAYGAQVIAERTKYREQLMKEIRDTNAAIGIAFNICNSLLSIKRQHIKDLKRLFDESLAAFRQHMQARQAGSVAPDAVIEIAFDLQTLSLPPLGVDMLQGHVLGRLSVTGRPINLTITLNQTVHDLSKSLEKRNDLIEGYKAGKPELNPALYFGLPQQGKTNADYPTTVAAIHSQTDDAIFFSLLLCKDLEKHGKEVAKAFAKRFGKGAPRISELDFQKAIDLELMPSDENYADWLSSFQVRQSEDNRFRKVRKAVSEWWAN